MEIKPLKLQDSYEITLDRISDLRGYFMRTYDSTIFAEYGLQTDWEQENESLSIGIDTVRGLHFQQPPFAETKLIRVVKGAIMDVFVDLRKGSATFGKWDSIELSENNDKAVYIPKGFAHGFKTLTENVLVEYKIDVVYEAKAVSGIRWNDPDLVIEWNVENPITSERDAKAQFFADFDSPF